MFYFIGSVVLFLLIFVLYFAIKSFHNIEVIKNMKNKLLSWVVSIIPVGIIFIFFSFVNSIIILFHYIIFLIIVNLILILLKKNKSDLVVIITVIVTTLYMGYAYYACHHVFETVYNINTNKNIGTKNFRIIQISDTHVGTTFDGEGFYKKMKDLSKLDADLFVITGDFIDDGTSYEDMVKASSAFSLLKPKYGVYFINGNHDRGYYSRDYSYDDLINELTKNNVKVLKDDVVEINDYIVLVGREDKQYSRMSIKDLVSGIDKSKYIIDLNHQPYLHN